jgi:DNA-binding NarL/FixJ family response regulator
MDIRVLIIADDRLARAGLAALLAEQAGFLVVGQIGGQAAAASALDLYRPDVLLWDMGWDPASSLERLADLSAAGAAVAALLPDGSQAAQVWHGGARALLPRSVDTDTLAAALAALAQGLAVLSPLVGQALSAPPVQPTAPAETLTPREEEVLRLLAEGLPNKTIARRLGISEHTVKFHINSLLGKLGVQSRTEAVVRAMRLGLISV